jgi:hypothetical protein
MIFIFINLVTTILPNENLVPTFPFYLINVIPIIAIDALLSLRGIGISSSISISFSQIRKKIVNVLAGIVLGLIFFMLYFPLITHTYNEVSSSQQIVWPSVTATIYFEMIYEMYPLLVISSMAAGILGVVVSSKLTRQAFHNIQSKTIDRQ